ncbi:MAG: hypothetical protein H7839_17740 [Magnetococcus sp. YQC-5]
MAGTLYTSKGIPINVGREIGKGGEGSVYEVPTLANQVAKLYHKEPNFKKQAKLKFMASSVDTQLLNYVTWPQDTLHSSIGGSVIGFLMPKVSAKSPIHMVYSPAHRRQNYPKAAWDFLLFVARNVAATFEIIHTHGHVIGDANQSNFMVGTDSKVVLIDSDSIQINARGTLHYCEVGVPHFTPPELQSLSSFDNITRTINHDNFGLALLIFHVLFGGRHPYSGVPLQNGIGDALEDNIKNFRYAYARDNHSRGFNPPPRSIPVSMLPETIEAMFYLAFTENGTLGARPTARQWVESLDGLRSHLKYCSASKMHIHLDHSNLCHWCTLEQQGVVYFLNPLCSTTFTSTNFNLIQVWGLIQAFPAPPAIKLPTPTNYSVTARPLPPNMPDNGTIILFRFVSIVVAIIVDSSFPKADFIALLIGGFGWFMASRIVSKERESERLLRRNKLHAAQQNYDHLVEQAKKEDRHEGFIALRGELGKYKNELEQLHRLENEELDKLLKIAHARQKQKFLDNFFIDDATIPGVGPARKSALRSFGIETATDISKDRVMQVHGFGESLTRAMLDWQASCLRRFHFNPSADVSQSDKNTIQAKFAARRVFLENELLSGPDKLKQYCMNASIKLNAITQQIEMVAKNLAQAQADLNVLK